MENRFLSSKKLLYVRKYDYSFLLKVASKNDIRTPVLKIS